MSTKVAPPIHSTTQQFIEIFDITNDVVIMKDGSTSMIITVDAMNFGLLAEEEQDAVMYSYAGLLNSLTYPVQIVIHSQTKDVTNYLNLLRDQETKATSAVKQAFIRQYREFVGELIKERNVLDKKFYIVVTAKSLEMGLLPPQTVVPGVRQIDISTVERSIIMEKARTLLEPRRDHLIGQFGRLGLYARQLQTQEIIQLFYTSYNPEAAEGQQITNTSDYVTSVVESQRPISTPPVAAPVYQPVSMPEYSYATAQQPVAPNPVIPTPIAYDTPPAYQATQTIEGSQLQTPPPNPAPVVESIPIFVPTETNTAQIAPVPAAPPISNLETTTETEVPPSPPQPTPVVPNI